MIPLPLGDLFTLYLSLFVITLAYLWYRDERRRQSDDWTIAKERLYMSSFLSGKRRQCQYHALPALQRNVFSEKKETVLNPRFAL